MSTPTRGYMGRQPRPRFTTPENPTCHKSCRAGFSGNAKTRKGRNLPGQEEKVLFEFDFRTRFFSLFLAGSGFGFGRAFLNGLGTGSEDTRLEPQSLLPIWFPVSCWKKKMNHNS